MTVVIGKRQLYGDRWRLEMKVLIVDDEESMRVLLTHIFKRDGHEILCAANGEEAITQYKEFKPDVVILDIMMPIMDGYQVCQYIRENLGDKETRICMLTGLGGQKTEEKGLSVGANDVLFKPISNQKLLQHVRNYI